jgi:hypothetical protein
MEEILSYTMQGDENVINKTPSYSKACTRLSTSRTPYPKIVYYILKAIVSLVEKKPLISVRNCH